MPRERQFRRSAVRSIVARLLSEDVHIPDDDEVLEALCARWVELTHIIARANPTPEEIERGRAFLRECLILACAPDRMPAPAESEAV